MKNKKDILKVGDLIYVHDSIGLVQDIPNSDIKYGFRIMNKFLLFLRKDGEKYIFLWIEQNWLVFFKGHELEDFEIII